MYVYAIVDRECHPPAEWRGLEGSQLSTLGYRSLAAVVSTTAVPPRPDTAAILCHEALVEALGVHHRALPVRFGTVFSDASAVTEALAERYESLVADMERIGGKVELGLIALLRAPRESVEVRAPDADVSSDAPSGSEGARYLQARRRAYARAEADKSAARQLAHEVDLALHDYALDRRLMAVNEGGLVLRAAYLVVPADVPAVRDSIDDLRGRRPDVAIVLSGPWPPYSFVSGPPGMHVEPIEGVRHAP
ncbi:MAG: GvpL/GvpF family gas vesicle protein [Kofleriaceae bacterium]|nr:GvpL/GvpF family gas vesicle protein [Kofleriaceae bacterium]